MSILISNWRKIHFLHTKLWIVGWRDGLMGTSTCSASLRTWVWITSTHIKAVDCCEGPWPSIKKKGQKDSDNVLASHPSQNCKLLLQRKTISRPQVMSNRGRYINIHTLHINHTSPQPSLMFHVHTYRSCHFKQHG